MKLFLRSIIFLIAITAFAPFASAQLYWAGGIDASGSVGNMPPTTDLNFNTANNWSTVPPNLAFGVSGTPSVPGAGDIAIVQADLNNGTFVGDDFFGFTNTPVVINVTSQNLPAGGNTVAGLIISNFESFDIGTGTVDINNTSGQPLTVTPITSATLGDFVVDGGVTLNYTGSGAGTLAVTNGFIVIGEGIVGNDNTQNGLGTFNIQSGTFTFDATGTSTQMVVGLAPHGDTGGTGSTVTQGTPAVGAVAATASTVITGSSLIIGFNSSSDDIWNVTNGSTLETGTLASSYLIALGSNGTATGSVGDNSPGSTGALNISENSTFNLGSSGSTTPTDLQVGTSTLHATLTTVPGGMGTITQSGTSIVTFAGKATTVELGDLGGGSTATVGGTGIYNLEGGTLNIGTLGSTSATDTVTFTLGAAVGSTGTLNQSGTSVLNVASGSTFTDGGAGSTSGTFAMTGGIANFNGVLTVGTTGTVNLGSTVTSGVQTSSGTLNISTPNLVNAGGSFTLEGGTLNITTAATNLAYNFPFNNASVLPANTVSTIDTTQGTGTFATFNLAQNLSGGGGITLIGTAGTTTFNLTGTNSYGGPTTITSGTLVSTVDNVTDSSALSVGATGVLTLNLVAAGADTIGSITGASGGMFNINFVPSNDTLVATGLTDNFAGTITLGKNGTAGTLQLFNGAFGAIDGGPGAGLASSVIIGDGSTPSAVTFGATTYTGSTTVNLLASLTAPNLDGSVVNHGTLTVTGPAGIAGTVTSNSGTLNTTIIGGGVTANTGTLTVTGAAGIAGTVTSNSGTLNTTIVGGSVTNSGAFTASASANTVGVNLTNTGSGIIASSAPLMALNSPTFTIDGDLMMTGTAGTLVVRTNGSAADQYLIKGAASTVAGNVQVDVLGGGKLGTTTYTIVSEPLNGLTVGTLTTNHDTALFGYTLTSNADSVDLTVTQSSIATYAQTPNQAAVAHAIDGTNSSLFVTFSQVSKAAATSFFPAALDELSPESLQYARMISFENSTFLAMRINGVDADLRGGYAGLDTSAVSVVTPGFNSGLGRSLGSLLASDDPAYHPSAPNGVNYYPGGGGGEESTPASSSPQNWNSSSQVISDSTPPNPYMATQNPAGPETPGLSEFIGGDAVLANLNQNQSAANAPSSKASYTSSDATAGISYRMTSHLAMGVLFDFNHTDAKTDSLGSKTAVDSYSPGLFATYFDHGFYVNGLFSFGYNNYANSRDVSFLGETASSHPSGQQYVGDLDFGYDFHPDKTWVIGPTIGATYTHLNIDSFTETGAPDADLSVNSQSVDSLRSRLGGHVIMQTNTGDVLLQPSFTAMWQHEYLDNGSGITSSFNDFNSNPFTIQTASPSRDSALLGVGMTATLSNSMALYLNYIADVGASDYFAQSVIGGFKARF